jgi:hypothetical protein
MVVRLRRNRVLQRHAVVSRPTDDGDPRIDVRRDAWRVEAAYLPFLKSLGVETSQS